MTLKYVGMPVAVVRMSAGEYAVSNCPGRDDIFSNN